jgi:hypothetical protein
MDKVYGFLERSHNKPWGNNAAGMFNTFDEIASGRNTRTIRSVQPNASRQGLGGNSQQIPSWTKDRAVHKRKRSSGI